MANRYWVGGTASWDGTAGTKWSATSGGAGGESVPTTADDVFFSNLSTGTCTISSGNTGAKSINCTGFTGTLAGTAGITIAGSITLVSGMTFTYSGSISLTGTGTLISAGKTLGTIQVAGSGITVTLGDALTCSGYQVSQGTLTTSASNYSVTATSISTVSNANVKVFNFNDSTVTLSGTNPVSNAGSNNTFDFGTSLVNISASSANLSSTNLTYYDVSFTSTIAGTRTISASNTFNNLTLTVSSSGISVLSVGADLTVNGTLTCAGSSAIQRVGIRSSTLGTTRTITAATLSANDCDFRDITISGGAAGTSPTRAGNCGGNSGVNFPSPKTAYRVGTNTTWGGSSSWALSSGGSGNNDNFPLAQDTAVINNDTTLGASLNLPGSGSYNISSIDCSSRTNSIALAHASGAELYGSYILGSGVTPSNSFTQTFLGRGTSTITTAGKTIPFSIVINLITGTVQLGDSANFVNSVTLTSGTFDAASYNLTTSSFLSPSSNTRTINMSSGTWTLNSFFDVWQLNSTNLTFNKGTANILLSNTTTESRTFTGGDLTYNKLTIGGSTGTSTTTFVGSNTFSEIASTKTVAHTILFTAGTTTTVGDWTITGTSGNVVTIGSSTAASHTLTKTGSGVVYENYLSISRSTATPAGTWYAGPNSTDGGNNSGWIFSSPSYGNFFTIFQ